MCLNFNTRVSHVGLKWPKIMKESALGSEKNSEWIHLGDSIPNCAAMKVMHYQGDLHSEIAYPRLSLFEHHFPTHILHQVLRHVCVLNNMFQLVGHAVKKENRAKHNKLLPRHSVTHYSTFSLMKHFIWRYPWHVRHTILPSPPHDMHLEKPT